MEPNTITTIIQTVGFPIAACGAMAWYVKYITDRNHEEMKAVREAHNTEMKEVTAALNANTLVIQKLCDKLDTIVGG